MKASDKLNKLKECKYLVVKGGITLIVKPDKIKTVQEAITSGNANTLVFQGEIIPMFSIIGMFSYEKYIKSNLVSKDIAEMFTNIRNEIQSDETRMLLRQ